MIGLLYDHCLSIQEQIAVIIDLSCSLFKKLPGSADVETY